MIDVNNPEHVLAEFSFEWGIYDMEGSCWLGNDDGPLVYTDDSTRLITSGEFMARLAATVMNERTDSRIRRFRAKLFEGGSMKLKDEIQCKRTPEEAIARLERG